MTRHCLSLLSRGSGRVVNIVSYCTECPLPTLAVYTASKAALMALTDAMRPEVAKYGVEMVMVNPGDRPRETPLCTGQENNYDEIENEMGEVGINKKLTVN